jgi:hypothetical protein
VFVLIEVQINGRRQLLAKMLPKEREQHAVVVKNVVTVRTLPFRSGYTHLENRPLRALQTDPLQLIEIYQSS